MKGWHWTVQAEGETHTAASLRELNDLVARLVSQNPEREYRVEARQAEAIEVLRQSA